MTRPRRRRPCPPARLLAALAVLLAACTATPGEGGREAAEESQVSAADARCDALGGGGRWRPLELPAPPEAPAGGRVLVGDLLAAEGDGGWVAVGALVSPDGAAGPAAWRSEDAERWEADRMLPVSLDGEKQRLFGAARAGGVTVAMGMYHSVSEGRPRPSAWRADDGVWAEVPARRELFGGPRAGGLEDVAAGAAGFVVTGPWREADGKPIAGVWRSPDGLDWSPPPEGTPLTAGPDETIYPQGVAAGASGVVVVGFTLPRRNVLERLDDGAAWRSADGATWERVEAAEAFGGPGTQRLTAVTATGQGFVAVGVDARDGTPRPAAWTSPDGRRWRESRHPAFADAQDDGDGGDREAGGSDVTLTSVTVAGDCLLAAGVVGAEPRLWVSADGGAWADVPLPGEPPEDPRRVTVAATQAGDVVVAVSGWDQSSLWLRAERHAWGR